MSFCQKHTNHHCIHAHNCKDPSHKQNNHTCKNKKKQQIPSILCRNSGPLKKITQRAHDNSSCSFNSSKSPYKNNQKCRNCQYLSKNIQEKQKVIEELGKFKMENQGKYRKLVDQNRQLSGVVEYYRQQMDRIVKCGDQDIKNQIKKNLKQQSQLTSKNKFLLSKLHQLQLHIDTLSSELTQTHQTLSLTQQKHHQLTISYQNIYNKLKKHHKSSQKQKHDHQSLQKQHKNKTDNYKIIIQESVHCRTVLEKQNKKLREENGQIKGQLQALRSKMGNLEKLGKIDVEMSKERENVLKVRVEELGKEVKELKQKNANFQKTLKLKQEQLQFSKKVIQKQLKAIKQKKQLIEQIEPKQQQNQTKQTKPKVVQDDNMLTRSRVKQNRMPDFPNEPSTNEYQIQIKKLKQRIIILQNQLKAAPSSQVVQQYILTIGASEAFRRIIEQKNVYIKKLIREKGSLLQALP